MKLEYKVIILSVAVGVLFILAEILSKFAMMNPGTGNSSNATDLLFEPLTMDQNVYIYFSILLLCLIFGLMLARMVNQILKEKKTSKQKDIEKDMILDFVPEIVIYVDKGYRIKWASRSLYTETGLSKKDIVDKYFDDIALNLFDLKIIAEGIENFKANRIIDIEVSSRKGKYWQILSNPSKDENGNETGHVFLAIDITKNKRDEEMKRRSYEQLESNIEQFATVIDNIRNPLSSIVLLADVSDDKKTADQIIQQCDDIEEVISKLDEGWAKSEDIRNFLKKHL